MSPTSPKSPQNAKSPLLTLNNGVQMPALGLGVFRASPAQAADSVQAAIEDGYRLIDTAAVYNNERGVGEGVRRSGIDRSELFVTTKLWLTDFGHESALAAFDRSLRRLGMDYVDLYLIHWPGPGTFEKTIEAWRAMEALLREGRARAIGVSNFNPGHLDTLLARSEVVPAVNQVELHPYFTQQTVRAADDNAGIITQAWSPIGGVIERTAAEDRHTGSLLEEPLLVALGERYGKTAAQVVLRWHLQHGFCAIPKSVRPERIAENIEIFDFELTAAEMARIDALDTGVRAGSDPELIEADTWDVTIDD